MKLRLLPIISLLFLALALTGCGPKEGKNLSEYPDATIGDSLVYYYAQLRAHEYWKAAMSDTTLRDPEQRKQFMEGIREGLKSVKMDPEYETYNRGVRRGAQMGLRIQYFQNTYGVEIDEDMLLSSMQYALDHPEEDIPELEYQNEFYRLYDRVKIQHRQREKAQLHSSLVEEAKKRNMKEINENLYYIILQEGSGRYPHKGDVICTHVEYTLADGKDLGLPSPDRLTQGAAGMPEVMELSYSRLNKGATALFATTADALFGPRAEVIGLKPDEILLVKVSVSDIVSDRPEADYDDNLAL